MNEEIANLEKRKNEIKEAWRLVTRTLYWFEANEELMQANVNYRDDLETSSLALGLVLVDIDYELRRLRDSDEITS